MLLVHLNLKFVVVTTRAHCNWIKNEALDIHDPRFMVGARSIEHVQCNMADVS
jgi:hypothetical protein